MTAPGWLAAAWVAAAPPVFVSEARQVRVDVVVSNDGVPVAGLRAEDFELLDDGVPRSVSLVASGQRRVHAVLVLDQSDSLGPADRTTLRASAAGLLDRMEPDDRATLLAFAHDLDLVSGPEAPAAVKQALAELNGSGATALYDAIHAGLTLGAAAPGRPFVVVLTDGMDRISWITAPQVWEAARRTEAALYFVSAVPWPEDESTIVPRPAADAQGRAFLRTLAAETGGRVWAGAGVAVDDQFRRVLAEVKSRYVLAYEADKATPGWHPIEVRLKNRTGEVRARRGYFVGRP